MKRIASALACSLVAFACGTTDAPSEPTDQNPPVHQSYRYVGSCSPSTCGDAIPEIGCANGKTAPVCAPGGQDQCGWTVSCEDDPDGTSSWSACDEAQCGARPNPSADSCAPGYQWGEPNCGSLNGGACQWAQSCYPAPSAEPCAESECPEERDLLARICNDGTTAQVACRRLPDRCGWQHECPEDFAAPVDRSKIGSACEPNGEACPEGEQCVVFEGLAGSHCAADPCAAITCAAPKACVILESYPAQIRCQ